MIVALIKMVTVKMERKGRVFKTTNERKKKDESKVCGLVPLFIVESTGRGRGKGGDGMQSSAPNILP